jgi:toxin ParE1/3/4
LAEDFIEHVQRALDSLVVQPDRVPCVFDDIRCLAVQRFPYAVYYRVRGQQVVILAVFHSSRNPEAWQRRL